MKILGLTAMLVASLVSGKSWAENFDRDKARMTPAGWSCGVTEIATPLGSLTALVTEKAPAA